MFDVYFRKLLWIYCPEFGEMTEQTDLRAKQQLQVLRSLRHYLWTHSRGHHTINRLEESGVERGKRWTMFLKGTRKSHRSERRGEAHVGFQGRVNTILNLAELI